MQRGSGAVNLLIPMLYGVHPSLCPKSYESQTHGLALTKRKAKKMKVKKISEYHPLKEKRKE